MQCKPTMRSCKLEKQKSPKMGNPQKEGPKEAQKRESHVARPIEKVDSPGVPEQGSSHVAPDNIPPKRGSDNQTADVCTPANEQ